MSRHRYASIPCLLLLLAFATGPRPVCASPDLAKALNELKREQDPRNRQRLVRRLEGLGGDRAAKALAGIVRSDPYAGVRVSAAQALGRIRSQQATSLLIAVARLGGPRAARAAIGAALGRRQDGLRALEKALGSSRTTSGDRVLLLRALGWSRQPAAAALLRPWMRNPDGHVASAAIRALLDHADGEPARRALVQGLLERGRTVEQLMPALEAADTVLDASLRPALERAATFLEVPVREAAEQLLAVLAALPPPVPQAGPQPGPGDRYGKPEAPPPVEGPPPVPVLRGRTDVVYVLDATGSTDATLPRLKERILSAMRVLVGAGVNARVGVLLYRGGKARGRSRKPFEVFPLTYDIQALRAWLEGIEPQGVDDRGLRLGEALREALARSSWRWRARRTVHLIADGPCGDLATARRAVTVHFRADRTRTRITYVARTRSDVPPEHRELARLGGTGAPEVLR